MKHISLLLALSLLMLGLGACGQSGPLYLPPPPSKTPSQFQGGPAPKATPAQAPGANLNQQTDNTSLFTGESSSDDDYQGDDSGN